MQCPKCISSKSKYTTYNNINNKKYRFKNVQGKKTLNKESIIKWSTYLHYIICIKNGVVHHTTHGYSSRNCMR